MILYIAASETNKFVGQFLSGYQARLPRYVVIESPAQRPAVNVYHDVWVISALSEVGFSNLSCFIFIEVANGDDLTIVASCLRLKFGQWHTYSCKFFFETNDTASKAIGMITLLICGAAMLTDLVIAAGSQQFIRTENPIPRKRNLHMESPTGASLTKGFNSLHLFSLECTKDKVSIGLQMAVPSAIFVPAQIGELRVCIQPLVASWAWMFTRKEQQLLEQIADRQINLLHSTLFFLLLIPHPTPGVVSNLGPSLGTGGGRFAQETPNITFPKKVANQ